MFGLLVAPGIRIFKDLAEENEPSVDPENY